MKLIKGADAHLAGDGFRGKVNLETSICYDFVVSLRALFNPRTFTRSRRWAADQLDHLGEETVSKGRFLFQGFDTSLGYGAARVIKHLPAGAGPAELVRAVAAMPPSDLAMLMLDDGETSRDRLNQFRSVLAEGSHSVSKAVEGLPPGWGARCRRVLRQPEAVQAELVAVLDVYLARVYSRHVDDVTRLVLKAGKEAQSMLAVLPPSAAIEQLTGGYTLGPDLDLRTVRLAPSVFIHPFMSARVDEDAAEALIIYGVDSDIFDGYDPVPMRRELLAALKAMSDPNRLTVLRLLAERPMYSAELASQLRLGQPTVHHHIHRLRAAGLVRQERDRKGTKYSIRVDSAAEILRSLEDWIFRPSSKTPYSQEPPDEGGFAGSTDH